jgi:hypothetical protein
MTDHVKIKRSPEVRIDAIGETPLVDLSRITRA